MIMQSHPGLRPARVPGAGPCDRRARLNGDIDRGPGLLADSLSRHRAADPEAPADALLLDLLPAGGVTDDTALVVVDL
ncbi:hypothetical protein ABH931_007301 [Streptacidiphilus sp. MAP12-33]